MRELPSEEEGRKEPAARGLLGEEKLLRLGPDGCRAGDGGVGGAVLACGGAPAHEWRNGADDSADPGVDWVDALERRVGESIEGQVSGA